MDERRLWRTYIFLVVANQLDVIYTYRGLALGLFQEGNPLLQAQVYTWWPIALKILALAALGVGIAAAVRAGWGQQRRLLFALQAVTAVYAAILILHVVLAMQGVLALSGRVLQ